MKERGKSLGAQSTGAHPHELTGPDKVQVREIECESLVLRKKGSKFTLNLEAFADGVGLWMSNDKTNGPMVAIFNLEGQIGIGLYAAGEKKVMNLCFTVDEQGMPYFQMVRGGEVRIVRPWDLAYATTEKLVAQGTPFRPSE